MKKKLFSFVILAAFIFMAAVPALNAEPLSIYDIQYTTDAAGNSPLFGQVIDCQGGIVTSKSTKFKTKLTIQDPNDPNEWGAILVRDDDRTGMLNDVNEGDWISLTNFEVDEWYGNTTLQVVLSNNPSLTVVSTGNPLPEPLELMLDEIAPPIEIPMDGWYVPDHNSEPYEAMLLKIADVTIQSLDMGSHSDNYIIEYTPDPNYTCWASDYANADVAEDGYHERVAAGEKFCSVTGVFEQYTNILDGWDYYQLLTRRTSDLNITDAGDIDNDCDVDLQDFSLFAASWMKTDTDPKWQDKADLALPSGIIDELDLEEFSNYWLDGKD